MKPAASLAGAKGTAETAELRKGKADRPESKQRRWVDAGKGKRENCGITAEELRKHSAPISALTLSTLLSPAPALVLKPLSAKPREIAPAETPTRRGDDWPEGTPYMAARYGVTRHWCVIHGGELVAVVTYRKGAAELVRRLHSAMVHTVGV